jgi:hypothetical protein
MEFEALDLSPVDRLADAQHRERLVAAILRAASPELERRRARAGVLGTLGGWVWPSFAAATVVLAVSVAALATGRPGAPQPAFGPIIEALGVVEPVAAWLDEGREPRVSDLVLALGVDEP